jgi:hypothetical protein
MLGRLEVAFRSQLALTLAWAVGSQMLWVAGEGGQHLAPQVSAAVLLLGAITLGVNRQWPLMAGLLLALAASARLPVGLALPLILWLYRPRELRARGWGFRPWLLVLGGMLIPAAAVALYNQVRFGSVAEFGYGLIRNEAGESVLDEWWYEHGIVSVQYIPNGLYTMLLRGLESVDGFPWFYGGLAGTSILLTMPILWWVFDARGRLAAVAALSVALVMLPNLMHGNPGFAQVGYRFIVDAMPMLWILLGLAFRTSMPRAAGVALAAGVVTNIALGVVYWAQLAGWS